MSPATENRQYANEQVRGIDIAKRRVTVIISTFDLDSHNSRIDQSGWDFSIFEKNPVIPLMHDDRGHTGSNGLPVAPGIPSSMRTQNQQTFMDIEFPPEGDFPLADTVWNLVKNGFLNAVSVGFEPLEWDEVDEEGEGKRNKVLIYRKQRLLEVSIVTIPSNDRALVQRSVKMNVDENVIRKMTEQLEGELAKVEKPAEKAEEMKEEVKPDEAKVEPEQATVTINVEGIEVVENALNEVKAIQADYDKFKSYFENKQPVNRAATKALEKFFKKILKVDAPAEEKKAWDRMLEAIDAMEENVEQPEVVVEPVAAEVIKTEVAEEIKEVVEERTPPSIPVAEEAPQPPAPVVAPRKSILITVDALRALPGVLGEAFAQSAVAALRRGEPVKDLDGVLADVERKLFTSIIP